MGIIDVIKDRARKNVKTIILPESNDARIYRAARCAVNEGIADIIIIGTPEEITSSKGDTSLAGITIVDPLNDPRRQVYEDLFVELRSHKGMTHDKAREIMLSDYTYYGCLMVKAGDADGLVSGASHSTADTLRPCLQIIKTKPGTKLASTCFLFEVPDCSYGENGVFGFADCVLEQNPDAEKLAYIAISAADSFHALTGYQPRVAMLSHSTLGSAKHADVDKVVEATRIARVLRPDILLDGELQFDAAIVPEVAASKAPDSPVAGRANVLIFPDIDAGNNCYKLMQRLAHAGTYGPMTTGMAAPVNDLSRGCFWEDIVGTIAITAVQAGMQE